MVFGDYNFGELIHNIGAGIRSVGDFSHEDLIDFCQSAFERYSRQNLKGREVYRDILSGNDPALVANIAEGFRHDIGIPDSFEPALWIRAGAVAHLDSVFG